MPKRESHRRRISKQEFRAKLHHDGTASHYFKHLCCVAKEQPDAYIVLICRESHRSQKDNIRSQVTKCKRAMKMLGLVWSKVLRIVAPAPSESARSKIAKGAEFALSRGGILVFESTSRAIRSERYNSKSNPDAQPGADEFKKLVQITQGVTIATIEHPDLSPAEERRLQTKRGMIWPESRGGRKHSPGYKKRRRQQHEPRALDLIDQGMSLGKAAFQLGLPKSTVQYWVGQRRTNFPGV